MLEWPNSNGLACSHCRFGPVAGGQVAMSYWRGGKMMKIDYKLVCVCVCGSNSGGNAVVYILAK